MNMKTTENGTWNFTREEKLRTLQEAKQKGVKSILEKYGLYPQPITIGRRSCLSMAWNALSMQC